MEAGSIWFVSISIIELSRTMFNAFLTVRVSVCCFRTHINTGSIEALAKRKLRNWALKNAFPG